MSDRVDTAMDQMKAATSKTHLNRPLPHPDTEQLASGDDPVLTLRERADRAIPAPRCVFAPVYVVKTHIAVGGRLEATSFAHRAMVAS